MDSFVLPKDRIGQAMLMTEHRVPGTAYVFMIQGEVISRNSIRQQKIALSTTEAEYMALSTWVQESS